jgi:hypothetical protein
MSAGKWWAIGPSALGTLWQSRDDWHQIKSVSLPPRKDNDDGDDALRVCFRNLASQPVVLCWMDYEGQPHHFYQLNPCKTPDKAEITTSDHLEKTFMGHAFCIATSEDIKESIKRKSLDGMDLVGGYRPMRRANLRGNKEHAIQVVSIHENRLANDCCSFLRLSRPRWSVKVRMQEYDPTPIDTRNKKYTKISLAGWPVFVEDNWTGGDKKIEQALRDDLQYAIDCLPEHAIKALKETTPIYVNRSMCYGPQVCPVNGKGLCFHPDVCWLNENGMAECKEQCVEIYESADYYKTRTQWGVGGVIIHELSHAYHYKVLEQGYENAEIVKCYKQAMKEGLYDNVEVRHGDGTKEKRRAYACTNQMEYFAELSAAFLGGKSGDEYNKWYPFQREQLRKHDPRAYTLLKKMWKVEFE